MYKSSKSYSRDNLSLYNNLLQDSYFTRNVLHLSGIITLGNLKSNTDWHFVTVCISLVLNDFIKNRLLKIILCCLVCDVCAVVFLTFSCLQKRSQKCVSFSKRNANAFVLGDRCRRGVCLGRRLSVIETDRQTDRQTETACWRVAIVELCINHSSQRNQSTLLLARWASIPQK